MKASTSSRYGRSIRHLPHLVYALTTITYKVFVANPHKSVAVQRILLNNRDRLLKFLPRFLEDRTEDDQFTDEKSFLVRQIETMPPVPVEPAKSQTMVNGSGNGAVAANGN